jgi:3-hydroxyisobutyrate dehydrogenase-like beta-hydroxyacid dehydrogenase
MKPALGFIGLGVIGAPMAARLVEQGLSLAVWNRTAEKCEPLVAQGARRASSPAELATAAEVVVTMVADGPALEAVTHGEQGVAAGLRPGGVHCDMSTIDLATARRLAKFYSQRGASFVHAPVLGNRKAAAAGQLLIFAGGPAGARTRCAPVFNALGKQVWEYDRAEQATATKLACNLLLGGMMELLAESLSFAGRAGIATETMVEIISSSALAAPMFRTKGETIARRNFTPSFYLRLMQKDLDLALAAARELGAATPATRAIREVYAAAAAGPRAERDYSAVFEYLEEQAGPQ